MKYLLMIMAAMMFAGSADATPKSTKACCVGSACCKMVKKCCAH